MLALYLVLVSTVKTVLAIFKEEEVKALLVLTTGLLLGGTFFYSHVEGLSKLDALYFSFVTLTTVGYGDFTPVTTVGKVFTMFYILIGLGVVALFITSFAQAYLKAKRERQIAIKERLTKR